MIAARVHHAARRRGGGVAARGARAAAERVRRIGVLMSARADDPEAQARMRRSCSGAAGSWAGPRAATSRSISAGPAADRDAHAAAGGRTGRARRPMSSCATARRPCRHCCRRPARIPIVFAMVADPVGAASSPAWRGRAATSPASPCSSTAIGGKVAGAAQGDRAACSTRVGVLRDPDRSPLAPASWAPFEAAAPSLGVEVIPVDARDAARDRARRRSVRARAEWRL